MNSLNQLNHLGLGVIEGFFGPPWSWKGRDLIVEMLEREQGNFYIYAPKKDPYLRKRWTENHPEEWKRKLLSLSRNCKSHGIQFGVGLSPFELHSYWNSHSRQQLKDKINFSMN